MLKRGEWRLSWSCNDRRSGRSMRRRLAPVTIFMMALILGQSESAALAGDAYQAVTVHHADGPVVLLGAGDLDGDQPLRPDVAAVLEDGTVLRLTPDDASWNVQPLPFSVEPIFPPGLISRPTIDLGDVLPAFPGDEIVVHSNFLVEVLLQTAPDQWERQVAVDFNGIVGNSWGARLGEVDTSRPGEEIVHIFEGILDFSSAFVTQPDGKGGWSTQEIFHAEVGMDAAIGDVNPSNPGNEIVITTEMGPTYEITPLPDEPGPWPTRVLWDDFENAGWRALIADVLPEQPGNEIVYGTRYTNRIMLSYEVDEAHEVEILFTGEATVPSPLMADVALGALEPSTEALEIVGVDSTGSVYLVQHDDETGWSGRTVWQDTAGALYAVVTGDFLPRCAGDEILVAGEAGLITLISRVNAGLPDLNCDGAVDVIDLLTLLEHWGECPDVQACLADLNDDGEVNALDLVALLSEWGG